jgi:hypothetical protein
MSLCDQPAVHDRKPLANRRRRSISSSSHNISELTGQLRDSKTLTYEFTRDPVLLGQYYQIRESEFRDTYGVTSYDGSEDQADREGRVLAVKANGLCVGGVRLNLGNECDSGLVPLETEGFRLAAHFPELTQKYRHYGQVSWMSLLPDFRGGRASFGMFQRLRQECGELGVGALFGVGPILNVQLYARMCRSLGYRDAAVHSEIRLPFNPILGGLRMHLFRVFADR